MVLRPFWNSALRQPESLSPAMSDPHSCNFLSRCLDKRYHQISPTEGFTIACAVRRIRNRANEKEGRSWVAQLDIVNAAVDGDVSHGRPNDLFFLRTIKITYSTFSSYLLSLAPKSFPCYNYVLFTLNIGLGTNFARGNALDPTNLAYLGQQTTIPDRSLYLSQL